jgi:septum formation protein
MTADIDETPVADEVADHYALRLAQEKADVVRKMLTDDSARTQIVLAADTVVEYKGAIFGKPQDPDEAYSMLSQLSGNVHCVHTAVALAGVIEEYAVVSTHVRFREVSPAEIQAYIASGEPFGKAGAYAIQGYAAAFVLRLEGSYSGVMGLPLCETALLLGRAGISLDSLWLASAGERMEGRVE